MIGGIICQTDGYQIFLCEFEQTLHELGAMALILWSIIQIADEHLDLTKTLFHAFLPLNQSINETVARHFGGDPIQKKLIQSRQKDAHWRHSSFCFKIMISCFGQDPVFPSACKWADFDNC